MVAMRVPWLVLCGRSILVGWVVLFGFLYLVERPVLIWMVPLVGRDWLSTESVLLDCLILAATGWVIARWHQPAWKLCLLVFALTLTLWDLGPELSINVPWLIRLGWDAIHDSRYLASFRATAFTHVLLFGSLTAGGLLSRPAAAPLSIRDAVTNVAGLERGK
ncbi:MAG TPA: hypothetical protein VLY24_23605 [Bryobacteraceae bacterium]|nr:hypothetical protein [Bryobacteraceae bacterium]